MTFKKSILFTHRWLGFISGLVVFIVSITGCIYCFQDEIQDAVHSWRKVAVQNKSYIAPSVLKNAALTEYPSGNADYIYYFGNNRPAGVLVELPKQDYIYVYFNPYTAQLLHTEGKGDFFNVIKYIHLYLLLPEKAGQIVVGVSVIIFIVLLITGIVLWWPKRKTDRKRSLTIKWSGRWKRINYDLHNVLGFYSVVIAVILGLTGLSMTFEWVNKGIYNAANLGKSYTAENVFPASDTLYKPKGPVKPVIDRVFYATKKASPDAEMFLISDDGSKAGTINVTAYVQSLHYGHSNFFFYDRYNGRLLKYLPDSKKSAGMQLSDMNYDIHVGQVLGLPGKILAFLVSLICASLPITGFVVWLSKRKKSTANKPRSVTHRKMKKQLSR
jgi:uncharacterized iron-regulated membrane protein